MTKPTIGFIGLGLMGTAMCENLLDRGYTINTMANRSRDNLEILKGRGAVEMSSAKEIAAASDIVMLCVDTSKSVEGRVYGDDGIIAGIKPGAVVIDFGTSLPSSTKKIGADMAAAGAAYMDAPIGRTPTQARDGMINLMCAGEKATFDKVEATLKEIGENVFYLGDLGSGHAIKLINNYYAQSSANAMAEAFVMADKLGIERKNVYDVMRAGPGGSVMMDLVAAYGLEQDPTKLAFSVSNAHKDLGYYDQMTKDLGVNSLMVQPALEALAKSIEMGRGDTMVSEQVAFFEKYYS